MSDSVEIPSHPGEVVRIRWLRPSGLTIAAAARLLQVHPVHLGRVLCGRKGMSARMAVRLERIGWGAAEEWMRLQARREIARARADENAAHGVADARRTG